MYWMLNQLLLGHLGKTRKVHNKKLWVTVWKERQFPQPYARLAKQFTFEDIHGHKSVRCQAYTRHVLDEFGKEFEAYNGPPAQFCSRVFTPILQWQLQGMPDAYAPTLSHKLSLMKPCGLVSIREATAFYLGVNLLNHLRCAHTGTMDRTEHLTEVLLSLLPLPSISHVPEGCSYRSWP